MNTGTIKFFNESKGYGFIKDENSKQEIFVHVTGLTEMATAIGTRRAVDKMSATVKELKTPRRS